MSRIARQILFVCSGNICRSPAAEGLCRQALEQHSRRGWRVGSCGTLRIAGEPAAPFTIRALAERGVDLEDFHSRPMSIFLLREADWIICMEEHHREAVIEELGGDVDLVDRIAVITEFHPEEKLRNSAGIYDFVREPWESYREGIDELERCVLHLVETLP